MSQAHASQLTDPLAISLEEAPRTIEYMKLLRQEASRQIKRADPDRYFALVDRGTLVAEDIGAYEQLGDFLISRAWCYGNMYNDFASARSDLTHVEGLLDDLPHDLAETFRMRSDYQYGEMYTNEGVPVDARRHLLAGLERARQKEDAAWQAIFHNSLGGVQGHLGDIQGQLDHLIASLRLCPGDPTILYNLAGLSAFCMDYETARAYLDEAMSSDTLSMSQRSHRFVMVSRLCWLEGNLDEALLWADKAVEAAQHCLPATTRQALGERATIYFKQGNFPASMQDLEEALTLKLSSWETCLTLAALAKSYAAIAAGQGSAHSDNRLAVDPVEKAWELLLAAEELLPTVARGYQPTCLMEIGNVRKLLGDYQGALQAFEDDGELRTKMNTGKVRNEIGSLRLLMKLEREEHEKEIQRLKAEQTKRELGNATLQLLAQTELLRDLRRDLLEIARKIPATESAARELRDRVKKLPCDAVDWEKYDGQFKAVHPDFIRRLTERAPDLTSTEVRICTMLRMSLKSHEIATLFCITERGVEFHRINIRKKLKLKKEEKLPVVLGAM